MNYIGMKAQSSVLTEINASGDLVLQKPQIITGQREATWLGEKIIEVCLGGQWVFEDTLSNVHPIPTSLEIKKEYRWLLDLFKSPEWEDMWSADAEKDQYRWERVMQKAISKFYRAYVVQDLRTGKKRIFAIYQTTDGLLLCKEQNPWSALSNSALYRVAVSDYNGSKSMHIDTQNPIDNTLEARKKLISTKTLVTTDS